MASRMEPPRQAVTGKKVPGVFLTRTFQPESIHRKDASLRADIRTSTRQYESVMSNQMDEMGIWKASAILTAPIRPGAPTPQDNFAGLGKTAQLRLP
jgi:hypothetical protein